MLRHWGEVWGLNQTSLRYRYIQSSTVHDGKEKNRNWKVNEVDEAKERALHNVLGGTEKFLDFEHCEGGTLQERRVSLNVKV